MNNLNELMKQAQQMQKKFLDAQEKMQDIEVEGTAGGGMIKVTLDGKHNMKKINIDKQIVNPEEIDILSDLIIAAYSDAKSKMESKLSEQMSGLLPAGMNLPF